ncbi:MAG: hypothetical protein QOH95_1012 [Gaiellaceae bacterium]|nr:hypothetical protein [Gaiellaceae bacterium]
MKNLRTSLALLTILALAVTAAAFGFNSPKQTNHSAMSMSMAMTPSSSKAADLRVTLDNLLGEHALLAIWATQAGYSGNKNFPALAAQLDKNSVAISKAIGSVYGAAAGKQFLDGKNLWRAHIGYFVDYTVASAKKDKAGQQKAVAHLLTYVQVQAAFFAKATGLPKQALVNDLTAHVLQLKGQLDAYAAGNYKQSYTLANAAYNHMFMTGDLLAGAIAKQKNLK